MFPMRSFRPLALGVLCLVAAPTLPALAATKARTRPTISSAVPLPLHIGDTLTIRGRNFLATKKRVTVAFKRDGSPAVSVKAAQATRTRIKVVVPASLAKYFTVTAGVARATRFRVRVMARRLSTGYTALKRSPLVIPGAGGAAGELDDELTGTDDGCDEGGIVEAIDGGGGDDALFDDAPRLGDALEGASEADPCSVDSLGDGLQDGGDGGE
jgi:hypothetical protein